MPLIKDIRNEISPKVKKYKGKLKSMGLSFSDIKVPGPRGPQDFNEYWLKSTTGSNREGVEAFIKIVEVLEARYNLINYKSLVSSLNHDTKIALYATIKAKNIIVPTYEISQEKLVEEALTLAIKSVEVRDVTEDFKNAFKKLGTIEVAKFIIDAKISKNEIDKLMASTLNNSGIMYGPVEGKTATEYFISKGIKLQDFIYTNFNNHTVPLALTTTAKLVEEALTLAIKSVEVRDVTEDFKNAFKKLGTVEVAKFIIDAKISKNEIDKLMASTLNNSGIMYGPVEGKTATEYFISKGIKLQDFIYTNFNNHTVPLALTTTAKLVDPLAASEYIKPENKQELQKSKKSNIEEPISQNQLLDNAKQEIKNEYDKTGKQLSPKPTEEFEKMLIKMKIETLAVFLYAVKKFGAQKWVELILDKHDIKFKEESISASVQNLIDTLKIKTLDLNKYIIRNEMKEQSQTEQNKESDSYPGKDDKKTPKTPEKLDSEVTLKDGKVLTVDKIMEATYNQREMDYYFKKLTPECVEFIKRKIAIQLAYDLDQGKKQFKEVDNVVIRLGINEEFDHFTDLTSEELKTEFEVGVLGLLM